MLGRTDSRPRLLFLLVVLAVAFLALVARLGYWQVGNRDMLLQRAAAQTNPTSLEASHRGDIYDRSGTVLLATTVDRSRLVAATNQYVGDQRRQTGDELIRILKLDDADAAALRLKLSSGKAYIILDRGIEPSVADQIRAEVADGQLVGISLEPEPLRVYPQAGGGPDSTLAAQLIGFVNRDGQGQYGVEQAYQDSLAGTPRVAVQTIGQPIAQTADATSAGAPGQDLRLTIDAGLQLAVEQELLAAWIADRAASISAVVMDPYTGEIYAEATYPSYDANQYSTVAATDPARFIDPIVSNIYEPGSVFKMPTTIAALQHGTVGFKTMIDDTGRLKLDHGTTQIHDANRKARGLMTFEDGIAYSRNVVAAKVALKLGPTLRSSSAILYDTWRTLGFGAATGIDVANEAIGQVHDPALKPWAQIDLANGSFGQGVSVTPIQLAVAFAAMMNGGQMLVPHVVKAVGDREIQPVVKAQVMSPTISAKMIDLMHHVVSTVPTYKSRTLVPGYDVGGKTGTAQIWDPTLNGGKGDWKVNLFNYSFVGYIGRQRGVPDLDIAIRIEEGKPTIARVGEIEMPVMSFELFRRIATDAMGTPDLLSGRPTTTGQSPDR